MYVDCLMVGYFVLMSDLGVVGSSLFVYIAGVLVVWGYLMGGLPDSFMI